MIAFRCSQFLFSERKPTYEDIKWIPAEDEIVKYSRRKIVWWVVGRLASPSRFSTFSNFRSPFHQVQADDKLVRFELMRYAPPSGEVAWKFQLVPGAKTRFGWGENGSAVIDYSPSRSLQRFPSRSLTHSPRRFLLLRSPHKQKKWFLVKWNGKDGKNGKKTMKPRCFFLRECFLRMCKEMWWWAREGVSEAFWDISENSAFR